MSTRAAAYLAKEEHRHAVGYATYAARRSYPEEEEGVTDCNTPDEEGEE